MLDELGSPNTYNHYPTGWAVAFSTPFKMFKRYSYAGGTCDPLVIYWPKGIKARGEVRNQYHHVHRHRADDPGLLRDRVPGPSTASTQVPLPGRVDALHASTRRRADAEGDASTTPCSARAASGSTAGRRSPCTDRRPASATSTTTSGSCSTSTSTGRKSHNLADKHPEKLKEMIEALVRRGRQVRRAPAGRPPPVEILDDPRRSWSRRETRTSTSRARPRCRRRSRSTSAAARSRSSPRSTSRRGRARA